MNIKYYYIIACLSLLVFASCSEQDDAVEEFPNWPSTNDEYFSRLYAEAQAKIAGGDTSWEVFTGYTVPASDYAAQWYDKIVVEKLETAAGTDLTSPILTDTVQVHYVGRLIPSANAYKTNGMEFDRSYRGTFDDAIATPATFPVAGLIPGFATALMHMHKGDHWRVYIPYQLGYGLYASGSIPAGSTLIFDLRLVNFWRKK
ncbi:MAG: FKBP-type peptidyl-prolyl cis-trans isomerase [Prevotella sp.]|nr:FKBP-type peptidyl-prolyl cis-trans isomerase [Prevotella sp.]